MPLTIHGVVVGTTEHPSAFGTYDLCNTTIKPNCAICDKNKKRYSTTI